MTIFKDGPVRAFAPAHNISSPFPNVERLTLFHKTYLTSYQKTELVLSLHVLPHWPNLRQIHSTTYVIRILATLKHLHVRLPAVNTLSLSWSENSQLLQNDLVFWSETVRQLTLDVRFMHLVHCR